MRTRDSILLVAVLSLATGTARAQTADSTAVTQPDSVVVPKPAPEPKKNTTTYLVPELEDAGYSFNLDKEHFAHRIGFSPAYGALGDNELFAFRISYSPNTWLGYEASLGHNPAEGLHALLHTFNVLLR